MNRSNLVQMPKLSKTHTEYELTYLAACISELVSYLHSNDIYRALSLHAPFGEKPYPQFTLGWMRIFQIQAQARAQTADQRYQIYTMSAKIETIRSNWRSAWTIKASKEFSARLNLWRDFLFEFRINPAANLDRYEYEVNRRVLIDLLSLEIDQIPPEQAETLASLDSLLRAIFIQGEFIWDEDLSDAFPKPTYWYLFGKPGTNIFH